MSQQSQQPLPESQFPEGVSGSNPIEHRRRSVAFKALMLLVIFTLGGGGGYMLGRGSMHVETTDELQNQEDAMTLMQQVNPPDGYKIPAVFGNVGPQLVDDGAIDLSKFTTLYQQQSKPLSDDQMAVLTKENAQNVVIDQQNAAFLLNFFWALGLANQNVILTDGPMMSGGGERVGGFASTAGWTLGSKNAVDLYANSKIFSLSDEQQTRLQEVAAGVYRPCCDNPTHFPDCNHGMAMLGLLELMASQNASSDEMFKAAKYVNAYWYPQQMLEVATALKATKNVDFINADPREVVSNQFSSISGYQSVHQWLSQNGLLEQAPGSGGSCGVQ